MMIIFYKKEMTIREYRKMHFVFLVFFYLIAVFNESFLMAVPIDKAVGQVANRLNSKQLKSGLSKGSWPGEANLTGSILAGMVGAYELKCEVDYQRSAEWGGDYITWAAQGNFYGDEVFALMRLSQIADDPCDNSWRSLVSSFYKNVRYSVGGTESYVSNFISIEPSTAVFYLANHVVAAYYVDAEDKKIWRQGLIEELSLVDNSSYYPVMALGAATWALASTGPLDQTSIHSSGEGAPYWEFKALADLPALLMSHQVQEGQPGAGGFYWQFEHTENSPNGYTEDAIFATRGLVASYCARPDPNLESAVRNAHIALLNSIGSEGEVWERLSQEGSIYYTYGGEMLQVLRELIIPGDFNLDGSVNSSDFAIFVNNWNASDCNKYCRCYGADLNRDGRVYFEDFSVIAGQWLKSMTIE